MNIMTLKSFRFKVEFMFFFVIEAGSRYTYINMASELNFVEYIAEQIEDPRRRPAHTQTEEIPGKGIAGLPRVSIRFQLTSQGP